MKNHYLNILGLKANATEKEIKRAYRKKAMQFHPDKNTSANAEENFIKINEAYEYLTNPQPTRKPKQPEKSAEEKRRDDFRERMERARKIYREREEKERKEQLEKFERFKDSVIYRLHIPTILFCYALYLLTIVDVFLPTNSIDSYVKSYQKMDSGYEYTFITPKGEYNAYFQEIITPYYAKKGKQITLNTTPILNDVKSVHFFNTNVPNINSTHHFSILIFFCLIFTIPALIVKKPGLDKYIAIHIGVIVSLLIITFILSNIY